MSAVKKKLFIKSEDLYDFQLITNFDLSPDGHHIVYSLQSVDKKSEKRYSNLWIQSVNDGAKRQFTYGKQVDTQPLWSPDSREIAFISNRDDEKQPQIYIIPFDGGEARKVTALKGNIGSFEWAPDGKKFVCMFRKKDKDAILRESDEKKKKLGVVSHHIQRIFYKMNGVGFIPKEKWHIWLINSGSGKTKQLTKGAVYDEALPSFSPDGSKIVFSSNRSKNPDMSPSEIDIFTIPSKGGEIERIETPKGAKGAPQFSPDGKRIAYIGRIGRGDWWKNFSLWVVHADQKPNARNLTGKYDINVMGNTTNDLPGFAKTSPPTWSNDGKTIYFPIARHGNTILKSVASSGGKLTDVVAEKGVVGTFLFDTDQSTMVYYFADTYSPGQLWVKNTGSGKKRKLTDINEKLLNKRKLGKVEEVWIKGKDKNDLQGWIVKPPNFRSSKKYPSILQIHGGPFLQYGNIFMHEFQFLAAQGYVVYCTNPRGSQGYGENHSKVIWNNRWGTVDYDDVMSWANYMRKKSYIAANRMGVTGGSYGGYMTNWIIGHTSKFKAAVTQRCVSNMISMFGSSDGNWIFQMGFGDKPPWENFEGFWDRSPLKHIGNAKTPTLVLHSEQDMRTAFEQAEQLYVSLKRLGVDSELVVFPGETHDLSRSGRTDRRMERLKHILRWFDKYLK